MPQMSPIFWLALLMYFILMLMILIMFIFLSLPSIKLDLVSDKKLIDWMW